MDRFRAMKVFVEVAQQGSLTAGSKRLGLSASAASRILTQFEDWLGVRLLIRTTRHITLTDVGTDYLARCIDALEAVDQLKRDAELARGEVTGRLRLTAPGSVARQFLTPVIGTFLQTYPNASLELHTSDSFENLPQDRFDLAIRLGVLDDSSLVARKLAEFQCVLVAAPEVIDTHGQPTTIDDLMRYPCVVDTVANYGAYWPMLAGKSVSDRIMIEGGELATKLTVEGFGISFLPDFMVQDAVSHGALIELDLDVNARRLGIHAVYPSRHHITPAARAFADLAQDALRQRVPQA